METEVFPPRHGYLIDMDGVIYRENTLIPGAADFVQALIVTGTPFLFLTNNSAPTPEDLAALPLRSPLGKWGSIAGLILVTIALIQTWLYPIMNLWSGLALLAVLILSYALAKKHRPPP